MDIVLIFNGLGNQMSQYAFYLAKRKQTKHCIALYDTSKKNEHNGYELGRLFEIDCNRGIMARLLQIIFRIVKSKRFKYLKGLFNFIGLRIVYEARNYDFNPLLLKPISKLGINFLYGGWHSEKNFITVKDEIKSIFSFPAIDDEQCKRFADLIKSTSNSVSLHVRRGDYVNINPDEYYQFGGVATEEYYKKAIAKLESEVGRCTFFVFSNDLEWCKHEFGDLEAYYVDCNSGKNSWRDMYLMTLCKHHINANSTFSWWGAWLAEQDGITICPERFIRTVETKDIYPEWWQNV